MTFVTCFNYVCKDQQYFSTLDLERDYSVRTFNILVGLHYMRITNMADDSDSSYSDSEDSHKKTPVTEEPPVIRSLRNGARVSVKFSNRSGRTASLLWYNFHGVFVKYAILHDKDYMDMYTYVNHPWGARDAVTGDVLNIDGQPVYYPYTPTNINDADDNDEIEERFSTVYIDLPLYSLKDICLQQVQKLFPKKNIRTIEDVLPRTLLTELKEGGKHEVHYLYKNMKVSKGSHVEHSCGENGLVDVVNFDGKNIPMGDHQLEIDSEEEATTSTSSDKEDATTGTDSDKKETATGTSSDEKKNNCNLS